MNISKNTIAFIIIELLILHGTLFIMLEANNRMEVARYCDLYAWGQAMIDLCFATILGSILMISCFLFYLLSKEKVGGV